MTPLFVYDRITRNNKYNYNKKETKTFSKKEHLIYKIICNGLAITGICLIPITFIMSLPMLYMVLGILL